MIMQKKVPILIQASISHYVAKRDRALSELEIYLTKPSGIGEHAKVTDEVIQLFADIDHANSVLDTINDVLENSIGLTQNEAQEKTDDNLTEQN